MKPKTKRPGLRFKTGYAAVVRWRMPDELGDSDIAWCPSAGGSYNSLAIFFGSDSYAREKAKLALSEFLYNHRSNTRSGRIERVRVQIIKPKRKAKAKKRAGHT